jgi:hypothetical protein
MPSKDYPNNIAEKILFQAINYGGTDKISMACLSRILAKEFRLTVIEESILFNALWKGLIFADDGDECYVAMTALFIILPQEDLSQLIFDILT